MFDRYSSFRKVLFPLFNFQFMIHFHETDVLKKLNVCIHREYHQEQNILDNLNNIAKNDPYSAE